MKITHILFTMYIGGTETMLVDIMSNQANQGHDVSLVLINQGRDEDLVKRIPNTIKVVYINRPEGSKNPWYLFKLNYTFARLAPDIVHVHNDKTMSMVVKRKGVKYVGTVHCIGLVIPNIHKWDKVFAISNAVKEDIKQRYNRDSTVVYNGVKLDSFDKKEYNVTDTQKHFKIVQIGRLDHTIKGQDITIKAIAQLKEKYGLNNVTADFFGFGPSKDMLLGLAKECNVENCISILGTIKYEDLCARLKDYDLLIQPSRNEGFGLTIAEGMTAKVPVLISDIPGPMEVIDNGTFGTVFKNENVDDCARALYNIITNYDKYLQLSIGEAYNHIEKTFNIVGTASRYIDEYNKL